MRDFTHSSLVHQLSLFQYLCGLTTDQFDIILQCFLPYIYLIPYPDCVGGVSHRKLDSASELMAALTVYRHGLHQGVMALKGLSKATIQRIFIGWVIFLATLFNEMDFKPSSGYLLKKMPKIFVETGYGLKDLVIDATEFKFKSPSNFELNSFMFSNYKSTQRGKALVGISPHGGGILFCDIFPGSVSDSKTTEECGAVFLVERKHEIMSDRGFSIQELCGSRNITLNRPKQKENDQFMEVDVATNFDIAVARIHVERFIGRVRDWVILNSVWPIIRMDIIS